MYPNKKRISIRYNVWNTKEPMQYLPAKVSTSYATLGVDLES
jgi:hypothetical protein